MADSTITFSTALDNRQLEKGLKDAERDVTSLRRKLESQEFEQSWLEKMMDRANEKIDAAKARVDELSGEVDSLAEKYHAASDAASASRDPADYERSSEIFEELMAAHSRLDAARAELDRGLSDWEGYSDKWDVANAKARSYESALEAAEARQRSLSEQLASTAEQAAPAWQRAGEAIRSRLSSVAEFIREKMSQAASKSVSPWEQFSRRVSGLLKRVFVFNLILKGLGAIKDAIAGMLMQNERFSASVSNLKATFNGVLSAIVSAALPALTALVNTLAGVLERIAGLVDSIFGTNLVGGIQGQRRAEGDAIRQANAQRQAAYDAQVAQEQARYEQELARAQEQQAKAQERQARAAEKNARAQEKANRQLMAFDEINALSAESAEEEADAIEDYMDGIEAPDFSSIEPPELEDDWTLGDFGDAGVLQGVLDWLDALKDRILNDVEGPFARIREGLQLIRQGWDELVQGIQNGDWALVWKGIGDMVIGALYVIEGAFGALMDWLDEITGGRFHDIFEGLKLTVHGFVEVVEGLLRGDLALAFQGLTDMIDGIAQTAHGTIDATVGFLRGGVNEMFKFLEEKMPAFKGPIEDVRQFVNEVLDGLAQRLHEKVESAKQVIKGVLDVIIGILTLDAERIKRGVTSIFDGFRRNLNSVVDFAKGIVRSAFDLLRSGADRLFGFLADKFPQLRSKLEGMRDTTKAVLSAVEGAVRGVLSGIGRTLDGALNGLKQAIRGAIDVVVGICTGSGDRVVRGLKGIVNGFISVIEGVLNGALSGVVEFANGIIEGLSQLPGISIPGISFHGVRLPRLAQGAVIPPNREFMAVLGDQSHGNNIEAPESLMRQVVREETGPMLADVVAALLNAGDGAKRDVVLVVGRKELARETIGGINELRATGELGGEIVFA